MGPLATTAICADLNLTASDQPETFVLAAITVHDMLCASLTIHVGLTLRPPCQLAMVRHRLVRVHDAAGKDVVDEGIIKLEPFIKFRGIFDALELDRSLLEVKVCMLADTPIARARSIPKSDFDEVLDEIMRSLAQINVPDPIVYVFIAGSKAPPAVACAPCAEAQVQAHPLMALGQRAYRRSQILTEQQVTECFELHTAMGMHARGGFAPASLRGGFLQHRR
jgi:hypothetical protein